MKNYILLLISCLVFVFSPPTMPLAADGTCGPVNGTMPTTAPAAELCSTGAPTDVTGTGPWRWFCKATDNGTTASCFAGKEGVFTGNGPEGGYITALAADPADGTTMYAGSPGGIYKSTDGGDTWLPINEGLPRETNIRSLTVDPHDSRIVYAGCIFGIYKSVDGGATWIRKSDGMSTGYFNAVTIDPSDSGVVYAASEHGILKSADAGETWTASGLTELNVSRIVIMPGPLQILAAATTEGFFTSVDGGNTWAPAPDPVARHTILAIAANNQSNTLYAATSFSIIKTSDGGATWETIGRPVQHQTVTALAIDPADDATLFAASVTGIYRSTDEGLSWTFLTATDGAVPIAIISAGRAIFVATEGRGILKSADGGTVWRPANVGLNEAHVLTLAADPTEDRTVYAGTYGGGLFKTTDGGSIWNTIGSGLTTTIVEAVAIDPATPETIYVGGWNGLYKSTDGGVSWKQANTSWTPIFIVSALAIAPSDCRTVYAGTFGRIFRSTDGGSSWVDRSLGLPDTLVSAVAVDPANSEKVFAGTYGGGVFRSTDGGATWSAVTGSFTNLTINQLAIDPFSGESIYAGSADGYLYRSLDGGNTWLAVTGFHSIRGLAFDPVSGQTIYVGTYSGVYRSTNGGENWSLVGSGLEERQIQSIAVGRQTIHAGMYSGGVLSLEKPSFPINGACGLSDGVIFQEQPSTGLCEVGIPKNMTGSGPWNWTCSGSQGGTDATCSADAHGICGPADGDSFGAPPAADLCASGIAGSVTGTGPWAWACVGSGGGQTAACSAGVRRYRVDLDQKPGGQVIASTTDTVSHDEVVTVTVIPQCGYHIQSVIGCNGTLNGSIFTTAGITTDCTITATFARDPVTWTVEKVQVVKGWKRTTGTIPVTATSSEQTRYEPLKGWSNVPWITVKSPERPVTLKNGTGKGTISYVVERNDSSVRRQGLIVIGCNAITVSQEGVPCHLDAVSPSSSSFPPQGGTIPLTVTAPAGCAWQVETTGDWLIPDRPDGAGTQTFTVEAPPYESDGTSRGKIRKEKIVIRSLAGKPSVKAFTARQAKRSSASGVSP